jgi:endonuclease/exonuclease/phosphatase family metal-dependent hydrolase
MARMIKKILFGLLMVPVLFILFLLISTLAEYRPPEQLILETPGNPDTLEISENYSALIWNIGYAGLGAGMDFFYDGGRGVRDTRDHVRGNFSSISAFLRSNDTIDFFLLQEVDIASKRSYRMNQVVALDSLLGMREGFVGINYQAGFVPIPVYSPLGKVKSGIVNYSHLRPLDVRRYSYPGSFSWPGRSFNLKRCYLVSKFALSSGKEFILVNTHNSAYDDGTLRDEEIKALSGFVLEEYKRGNYVLIGGDWNQCPSGFKPQFSEPFDSLEVKFLPPDFLPGWKQAYPTDGPTNRRIQTPYNRNETLTTVIDFYIASPNIFILEMQRVDLDFKHSDHQPVIVTFRFI